LSGGCLGGTVKGGLARDWLGVITQVAVTAVPRVVSYLCVSEMLRARLTPQILRRTVGFLSYQGAKCEVRARNVAAALSRHLRVHVLGGKPKRSKFASRREGVLPRCRSQSNATVHFPVHFLLRRWRGEVPEKASASVSNSNELVV
jgi:hypothetical protein